MKFTMNNAKTITKKLSKLDGSFRQKDVQEDAFLISKKGNSLITIFEPTHEDFVNSPDNIIINKDDMYHYTKCNSWETIAKELLGLDVRSPEEKAEEEIKNLIVSGENAEEVLKKFDKEGKEFFTIYTVYRWFMEESKQYNILPFLLKMDVYYEQEYIFYKNITKEAYVKIIQNIIDGFNTTQLNFQSNYLVNEWIGDFIKLYQPTKEEIIHLINLLASNDTFKSELFTENCDNYGNSVWDYIFKLDILNYIVSIDNTATTFLSTILKFTKGECGIDNIYGTGYLIADDILQSLNIIVDINLLAQKLLTEAKNKPYIDYQSFVNTIKNRGVECILTNHDFHDNYRYYTKYKDIIEEVKSGCISKNTLSIIENNQRYNGRCIFTLYKQDNMAYITISNIGCCIQKIVEVR